MVSPLDVEVMVVAQRIHYYVWTRSSVEYVSEDVQRVYCKSLDKITQGNYEIISPVCLYYGADNYVDVRLFVLCGTAFVE